MDKMIPAIPGNVRTLPIIAITAIIIITYKSRAIFAAIPIILYPNNIIKNIITIPISPALTLCSNAFNPIFALCTEDVTSSNGAGKAPPRINAASCVALFLLKLPVISHLPPLITSFTTGLEMILLSKRIIMLLFDIPAFLISSLATTEPETAFFVPSSKAFAPFTLNSKFTAYPPFCA